MRVEDTFTFVAISHAGNCCNLFTLEKSRIKTSLRRYGPHSMRPPGISAFEEDFCAKHHKIHASLQGLVKKRRVL